MKPLAIHALPDRSDATYASCKVGADGTFAAMGFAWGGRNPKAGGYDHFCRGFTLVSLKTGAQRTIVRLPAAQRKGLWTVDEPIVVGGRLAYQRYVGVPDGPWEIDIVNLGTGRTRRLDQSHGKGIVDIGPLITRWKHTLVWVSGVRNRHDRVVYEIHAYDVRSGRGAVVATSRPGVRFIDAYMSGPLICFLRQARRGTDAWVKNLRTRHFRQITGTGKVAEAVITGPWVAWSVLGANAIGPVMVEALRTGHRWTATKEPSYQLSAGNGLLTWDSYWKNRWTILDLTTGRTWTPAPIVKGQSGGTSAHVQGSVIIEGAAGPGDIGLDCGSVQVYRPRHLPGVGSR